MYRKLRRVELLMKLHLRAAGCHLPYGITQCYLLPDTSEHTQSTPVRGRYRFIYTSDGWKAELTYSDWLHTHKLG